MTDKIAIVGIGCLYPDAADAAAYWENITSKKVSIKKVPESILNKEVFYRPEVLKSHNKQEKSYTEIAGLIEGTPWDTVSKFRIPPTICEHMDPNQHVALYCMDQALINNTALTSVARERIGVFLGNSSSGILDSDSSKRLNVEEAVYWLKNAPLFQRKFSANEQNELCDHIKKNSLGNTVSITEDTAPGSLLNLVAGRISNVFNYQGPSCTVDAACASSLAAMLSGIKGLILNEIDALVCGAADMCLKPLGFVMFSAINALSSEGSFPFDSRANGFVIGQGGGIIIAKRLEDALRSNDHIYAVITGYGHSSDGKGKYIAAPNENGQADAVMKACKMAGYSVDTIEMIETHGTGTAVGDVVEVSALKRSFAELGCSRKEYCGIGSVKSNIGHLKNAAGIAGLTKAVLALHHKVLPPTASINEINPKLGLPQSPFYVLTEKKPWAARNDHPRRANVSAFGFGGANVHIALEEYRKEDYANRVFQVSAHIKQPAGSAASAQDAMVSSGSADSGKEALLFWGESEADVRNRIDAFIAQHEHIETNSNFFAAASRHNALADHGATCRLGLVAGSLADLKKSTNALQSAMTSSQPKSRNRDIFFGQGLPVSPDEIALLFPGQASQYPRMLSGLYRKSPIFQSMFAQADAYWMARYGHTISSLIYPEDLNDRDISLLLRETENAHATLFVTCLALYYWMHQMGLRATHMVGHSLGEVTAMAAASVFNFSDGLKIVDARGHAFTAMTNKDRGKMCAINASAGEVKKIISQFGSPVNIANINSPEQVVVSDFSECIDRFTAYLRMKGIQHTLLNVSHAFHSPAVAEAAAIFARTIPKIQLFPTVNKVVKGSSADSYRLSTPEELSGLMSHLEKQITDAVNFDDSIHYLANQKIRVFLEIGPGNVLTNLTGMILKDRDLAVLSTSMRKGADDIENLHLLRCALFAEGVPFHFVTPRHENAAIQACNAVHAQTPRQHAVQSEDIPASPQAPETGEVVITGAAIGLPGSYKESIRDDNFDQIFDGRNFLERLTDGEKEMFVNMRIGKLSKNDQHGAPTIKILNSINEVIQIAGKIGKIDVSRDYSINEKDAQTMSECIAHSVAIGYEALADAHIPLVREKVHTSSGSVLPGRWILPQEMQNETGVIFAHGFPMVEDAAQEMNRLLSHMYCKKYREDLIEFYEELLQKISDNDVRRTMTDWFAFNYQRLSPCPEREEVYQFNHEFMQRISSLANNRIAQQINAKGPNFMLNAACSSTTTAISLAEDMISAGRVKRMLIVGGDDATSKSSFPLLGAGFLCSGAITTEADVHEAAVPFDKNRNGMIVGSGFVGLVIEKAEDAGKRGIKGICSIMGTHLFNNSGHPSRIDTKGFSEELDSFMGRMTQKHKLQRSEIARDMIYISHETYTPPRGGCSQTEFHSLKRAFGDNYRHILIGNTKGMTGHTMGAGLEDAIAAKALQYGKVPPVVNHKTVDPELDGLQLITTRHDNRHDRNFALRMAGGFGSQGNYMLLKKISDGEDRIGDRNAYSQWVSSLLGSATPELTKIGRILVATDGQPDAKPTSTTSVKAEHQPPQDRRPDELARQLPPTPVTNGMSQASPNIAQEILRVFAAVTKYPVEMLDLQMEMEADLGIDTVKQATVWGMLGEKYGLAQSEGLQLSLYPTIGHIVDFICKRIEHQAIASPAVMATEHPLPSLAPTVPVPHQTDPGRPSIAEDVLQVFAEVTKYPVEMLDLQMEMEADLGIDTVKQATVWGMLGEKYGLVQSEGLQLSLYPTIGHIVDFIVNNNGFGNAPRTDEYPRPDTALIPAPATEALPAGETDLTRQIVTLKEESIGKRVEPIDGKRVWLWGDEQDCLDTIRATLSTRKVDADCFVFSLEQSPDAIAHEMKLRAANGAPDIIIDCTHVQKPVGLMSHTPDNVRGFLAMNSTARFAACKALAASTDTLPSHVICLTALDGALGCDPEALIDDPTYAALIGFYRSIRKEWKNTTVKIIDLEPHAFGTAPEDCLARLLNELEADNNSLEICYRGQRRSVVKIDEKSIEDFPATEFPPDQTILVTGGARGIAASVVDELTTRYNAKIIAVGSTKIPDNIEVLAAMNEADFLDQKKVIRKELQRTKSRVSPAMVEKEFNKLSRAVEIYRTLENVRARGHEIHYVASDIRDFESLSQSIGELRNKVGPINALVHAAGIDCSHLMETKSVQEFEDVASVKMLGAYNLSRLLANAPLKYIISFGSISGRFGSAGQLDYCAANSFLSMWSKHCARFHAGCRAITFDWSGWDKVGIAYRNDFVRALSEEIGMQLIDPPEAVRALTDELEHASGDTEVILHKGLGNFIDPSLLVTPLDSTPLIDRIVKSGAAIIRAYRLLSVKRDALIDQHRIGKTPIMAAVTALEMGAEYYSLVFGPGKRFCFRNISIPKALKFFRNQPVEVRLEGTPVEGKDALAIAVKSKFTPKTTGITQMLTHAEMIVSGDPEIDAGLDITSWPCLDESKMRRVTKDENIAPPSAETGQQRIVFGGLYSRTLNSLNNNTAEDDELEKLAELTPMRVSDDAVIYPVYFPVEQLTNKQYPLNELLINPCFMDSLFQSVGFHSLNATQLTYLPWRIEELGVVRPPKEDGLYHAYARLLEDTGEFRRYTIVVVDEHKEICYYARNATLILAKA